MVRWMCSLSKWKATNERNAHTVAKAIAVVQASWACALAGGCIIDLVARARGAIGRRTACTELAKFLARCEIHR